MSTASQLDIKLWKADPRVTRAEIETQQFRALPGVNNCISTSHPWRGGGTTTNNTHKSSHGRAVLGSSDHNTQLAKMCW